MKKALTLSIIVFVSIFLIGTTLATAGDVILTTDGKVPGKPFEALQMQINELREQLNSIQVNAGLEVYDGGGLFLGYLVDKSPVSKGTIYLVFNPEIEAFFKVIFTMNDVSIVPYQLGNLKYLSSDCTGPAYSYSNPVQPASQDLWGFTFEPIDDTLYMVDKTKPPIPDSEINSWFFWCDEEGGCSPRGWKCDSYDRDPRDLVYPVQQVDHPIANTPLQYPIIIKAAEYFLKAGSANGSALLFFWGKISVS